MFHSTDFTSKTAITTPTKTLRGEVVLQVTIIANMTQHDLTSWASGDQDSQGGLQGPQSLWRRIIWHDSPGEYGYGARIHLKHYLNLTQQAKITSAQLAQLDLESSIQLMTQGVQLNSKTLTKLHSEYLSLTLIVIMYNLSYTFPIFRTSCQSSWRWTLCPPLARVA